MIVHTPNGTPALACDACGCRHFDRLTNCCYECGEAVSAAAVAEYHAVLAAWRERTAGGNDEDGRKRD